MGEKSEQERGDLVWKRREHFATEDGDLGALDGVGEAELRVDLSGMGLAATEFLTDCTMQLDEILRAQEANLSVSR